MLSQIKTRKKQSLFGSFTRRSGYISKFYHQFTGDSGGNIVDYIVVLAFIAIIIYLLIPKYDTTVNCWNGTAITQVNNGLNDTSYQSVHCSTYGSTAPSSSVVNTMTNSAGISGSGSSANASSFYQLYSGSGSSSGSASNSSSSSFTGTPVASGSSGTYNSSSFATSSQFSFGCSAQNINETFTIPQQALPGANGTQEMVVTNKSGFGEFIAITNIDLYNQLQVSSYQNKYQYIPNNSSASFYVNWNWNEPNTYTGPLGYADLVFQSSCTAPALNQIYIPLPNAPSSFQAQTVSAHQINLSWQPVSYATSYLLYENWQLVYRGTNTSFQATNLSPGTSYSFELEANNATGNSPFNYAWATTTGVSPLPQNPSQFQVSAETNHTLTLSWSPGLNDANYVLMNENYQTIYSGTRTSFTVNDLSVGTWYQFILYAYNAYGNSGYNYTWGETSGANLLPVAPRYFTVTHVSNTSVSTDWMPSSGATSYTVSSSAMGTKNIGNTDSYTFTGLAPGTGYVFYVRANNAQGSSSWSNVFHSTTGTNPVPSTPTHFTTTNTTDQEIDLAWDPSTSATQYVLAEDNQIIYRGSNTSDDVTGLNPGTTYYFSLYASNASGNSGTAYENASTVSNTFNGTSNISTTCTAYTSNQTGSVPSGTQPGATGVYDVLVQNTSAQSSSVELTKVTTSGAIFSGATPATVSYSTEPYTVPANQSISIPIDWALPANASSAYTSDTGTINAVVSTVCG